RAILERLIRAEHGDKRTINDARQSCAGDRVEAEAERAAQFLEGDESLCPPLHQSRIDDGRSVVDVDANRQAEVERLPRLDRSRDRTVPQSTASRHQGAARA